MSNYKYFRYRQDISYNKHFEDNITKNIQILVDEIIQEDEIIIQ